MPDKYGRYSYYDTPDGQDGPKKCWYISRIMAKLGIVSGTVDALIVSAAQSPAAVVGVYARHIGVLVGAGLAFTCATFISTDLRKVDDQKNHALGALAASAIVGSALSNRWVFATTALVSCPMLHTVKTYRMNGINVFTLHEDSLNIRQRNFSLNSHTFQIGTDAQRRLYEEKNEEFYRQLDKKRAGESSV